MIATRRTPDQIRADIVAAAIDVIGRLGIAGLTHRAVAATADVSLSSTTYHYASREDIIAAAFRHVVEMERRRIQQGTERIESLDQRDPPTVRTAVARLLQDVIASRFSSQIYLRAQYELQLYAVNQPDMREDVRAWQGEIDGMAARMLTLLGAPDPGPAARIMVAAADGLRLAALTTGQSTDEVESDDGAALSWLIERIFE